MSYFIRRIDKKDINFRLLTSEKSITEFASKLVIATVSDKLRYITNIDQSSFRSEDIKLSDPKVLTYNPNELWSLITSDKRFQGSYVLVIDVATGTQAVVYFVPDNRWSKGLYKKTFFK